MPVELKPWDSAEILTDEETIKAYLEEAFAEGEPQLIAKALGDVARARNVAALARETNLSRDTIYSAFGPEGNPTLSTLIAMTKALGFDLTLKPRTDG
ncbi:MAG TPA: putative addiction module antidote protein [Rhizobiaceae bacterium]|nr:putative addiction module antidote protein [Rhizobiaceae bacterium]